MSQLKKSKPVKLIMSIIFKEKEVLECVMRDLNRAFGKIDFVSEILPFDFTDYYCKEMGNPLKRQFISFLKLIPIEMLPKIKFKTNRIELRYTRDDNRQANIDPGYISAERLVLSTGKNFTHRIYLNDGVYADLTLIYQNKSFRPLPWTYPDYASPKIREIFRQIREKYLLQSHLTFDNNAKL
ncbi:MAG: DUF4416 family protein [Campylobacterota bacterium]|nr:DUF4416 family protein [Campylobacterota bacterium]